MLEINKQQSMNPYIAGKALGQDRGFFGRDGVLNLVANEMLSPDRNAVVLFGQRRIGKTSILLQLLLRLPAEFFLPIYFDLIDYAATSLGRLLYELATAMAQAVSMAPPEEAGFDDEGVHFRRNFLPSFYARLGSQRRPVLLLDEFDILAGADESQIPASAASRTFFPYMRRLMEGEPTLGFVFVAGRKADELSMDVKAAFKTARYKRVSLLDDGSSRDLILAAEKQGTMTFSSEAVDQILKLTSGHPYLTQLVCQVLWDEKHKQGQNSSKIPRVEAADVAPCATKAQEAGESIFEWIWDGLPAAERVIYAAVAHATDKRPHVSGPELIDVLQRNGVRFLTRELELAPGTLASWEMLREHDGNYSFAIELMRRWVIARKPLPKVKDELDRIVPLAENLFQSGDGFYRRGNLENSKNLLQQALTVNPNHLRGRLLLAQVMLEQGKLEDSIRELEEAYRHDEAASRYPLARTLLLREEECERDGDSDKALALCERVLEIVPSNTVAAERRTAIWRKRGDQAFAADLLDDASSAYEKIGAADLLQKVAARKKKLWIDQLQASSVAATNQEEWERAAKLYRQLLAIDPNEKRWKEALERCETEHKFARQYSEALQAIRAENWKKAQAILIDILRQRAEYKDAPELLVRALKPPSALPVNAAPAAAPGIRFAPLVRQYAGALAGLLLCLLAGLIDVPFSAGNAVAAALGASLVLAAVAVAAEFAWRMVEARRTPQEHDSLG